jgi:hypothetical protein
MTSGRILGDESGRALVAGDVVIGAGWGNGPATMVIAAGSNDQRGSFTVTSVGTGQAQATATLVVTFALALDFVPFVLACRGGGTAVLTVFPKVTATAKTGFTIISNTLPVAAETTEFIYFVN